MGELNLFVTDDSGCHFVTAQQELVQLSLFGIKYNQQWHRPMSIFYRKEIQNNQLESITRLLQLKGLEIVDFLQPEGSPFWAV